MAAIAAFLTAFGIVEATVVSFALHAERTFTTDADLDKRITLHVERHHDDKDNE